MSERRPETLAERISAAAEQVISEAAARRECIDGPDGCEGAVELRWPGYGHRSWPRCEKHGAGRVAREEEAMERYPDGPCAPADFDPLDAGERWDEDDPWP